MKRRARAQATRLRSGVVIAPLAVLLLATACSSPKPTAKPPTVLATDSFPRRDHDRGGGVA